MYCTYKTTHGDFYYYGKTSVDKINAGYQGSGVKLKAVWNSSIPQHLWSTEIIDAFEHEADALQAEAELVTIKQLSDPYCLNVALGGPNGKSLAAIQNNYTTLRPSPDADTFVIDHNAQALQDLTNADGRVLTTSRIIAKRFGKEHKTVLSAIRNLDCSAEFVRNNFVPSDYTNERGKTYQEYQLTRQGFCMLAMGFTGSAATKWKESYIHAFDLMEQKLTEGNTAPTCIEIIEQVKQIGTALCIPEDKIKRAALRAVKKQTGLDLTRAFR